MDEVIRCWHSELIAEEAPQAFLSQDCFSDELAPSVMVAKFLRRQVQHVSGTPRDWPVAID
eukprot:10405704-Lingulodinium_polyedra.AAC.1